jgi:hypothetical protein
MSSFIGGPFQAAGALEQGQQESQLYNYNAQVQTNNANLALRSAALNAQKQSVAATRAIGASKAAYGASGVTGDSGSVMSVMASSAANAELDRQNILYGGQVKAINYENQASLDQVAGNNALNASYFNAIGSMFGGVSQSIGNSSGGSSDGADAEGNEQGIDEVNSGSGESTALDATGGDEALAAV